MVVRGMNYIDEHPEIKNTLLLSKNAFDKGLEPLIETMNYGIEPSGAMVGMATTHLYYAQKNGWEKYISEIQKGE
jgi:hypothetical protein